MTGYASFLLEERKLWGESHRDDYNTHCPVPAEYREMLKEWKASRDKFNLTAEDVKRIVAKAPHGCVNGA